MALLWLGFVPAYALCETGEHDKGPVTNVADGHAIANALIGNPEIIARLREDALTSHRVTKQLIQAGVTEYVIHVSTCAMCNPGKAKKGSVSIVEDVRPTYMDGPVEYTVSFNIKSMAEEN